MISNKTASIKKNIINRYIRCFSQYSRSGTINKFKQRFIQGIYKYLSGATCYENLLTNFECAALLVE